MGRIQPKTRVSIVRRNLKEADVFGMKDMDKNKLYATIKNKVNGHWKKFVKFLRKMRGIRSG